MPRSARKSTRKNVVAMPVPESRTATIAIPAAADVARRAFELYCERGCQDGHDVEDWLNAERELQTGSQFSAA
jgi:hypothetical protein